MVQLSHRYMTRGKTIALTIWTFVSKVMSLLFNTVRFVTAFLPRNKHFFNFMAAVTVCSNFGAQENKNFHCFPSICHEVMGPDVMNLSFLKVEFQASFFSLLSPSSRDSLVLLYFLLLERYYLHVWGCWHFSWQSFFFRMVFYFANISRTTSLSPGNPNSSLWFI